MLRVCLLTRGTPDELSGGHQYHRRMIDAAPRHDTAITVIQAGVRPSIPSGHDVVVVDSITAWRLAPALLGRLQPSPPIVAMVHQQPGGVDTAPVWHLAQRALDRFVYRRCRVVIAASRSLEQALVDEHGIDASRVRLVEPGCDLPPANPSADLRQGRRVAALSIGSWYPNKGVLELLDAFAALPPDAATLHLAGRDDVDRTYTARVRRRLAAADLRGRVVLHGAVDRRTVAELYAGSDFFVLPSRVEGYATVFAEALAAGLPTVGWRLPYLERLATDGAEGCLVSPGDVGALSDALLRLATDEPWRRRLAAAAQRRGTTLARWDDTAAAFFTALRRAAAGAAVEPADDRTVRLDVDAAHAGVLDEHPPRDPHRHAEAPGERGLDGADVRDDHHD